MTDTYSNIIDQEFGVPKRDALAGAIGYIDDDPEKARRSIELAQATGVPPTSIIGDLEGFERQHKATLASDIVGNNAYISDWLAKEPMAARLANDDYGNLDALSQAVMKIVNTPSILHSAIKGFKEGFGEGGVGNWMMTRPEDVEFVKNYRMSAATLSVIASPVELSLRILGGLVKGTADAAAKMGESIYQQYGGSESNAKRFGRDMGGMVEMFTNQPLMLGTPMTQAAILKARQTLESVKPWVDAGLEPPIGVSKDIDRIKIEQSDLELSNLDEAFKEAQKSATRERSPDITVKFLGLHPHAKIGVSGEAVAKLYGDKPPVPDDGLLGWVPGIADQLETAVAIGGDIEIPLADWLARADPEMAKQLHDDIRVRPGGVTKNEAKVLAQIEEIDKPPASLSLTPAELKFFKEVMEPQYGLADEVPSIKLEGNRLTWAPEDSGPLLYWIDETRIARNEGERLPPSFYRTDLHKRMIGIPDSFKIAPIDKVRAQAALKPLFERKLTLQRLDESEFAQQNADLRRDLGIPSDKVHAFNIVDDLGEQVAYLDIAEEKGGKRLYVDDIRSVEGFGPNDLGPSHMRSILRQLKAEFPEATELTGMRVSGARDKAGTWDTKGKVTIKLDEIASEKIAEFVDGIREDLGADVTVTLKPTEALNAHEKLIVNQINEVLSRIVPSATDTKIASKVEIGGKEVGGAFVAYEDAKPIIAVSLNTKDAGKTTRHEAIHFLRELKFFDDAEWSALEQGAKEGDWIKKHNIKDRYKDRKLDETGLLEEAIAEEFGDWGSTTEAPRKHYNAAIEKAFEKLAAFFKEVLEAMKEIFGHVPKIDELFEKIESGEVGRRKVEESVTEPGAKASKEPELPGMTRMEDRAPFAGSFPGWMTQAQRDKYAKLIDKKEQADFERLEKKELERLERERSQEWKANKESVKDEVAKNIEDRPDIAADRLFGNGILYGDKLSQRPKLGRDWLTEEQIKALPEDYIADVGMHPDDVAGLLGYKSGKDLVDRLSQLTQARTAAGMTPLGYKNRLIEIETDRVMNERYGETPEEALREAREYALSEVQEELLHEQTLNLAIGAKLEFSITRDQLKFAVRTAFDRTPIENIDSNRYMTDAGRAGRAMEDAFLKGDVAEAFRQSQRQYLASMFAKEAVKLEKEITRFERQAKRFQRREVKNIEPSATLEIRELLLRAGRLSEIHAPDLANIRESLDHPSLAHYTDSKIADKYDLGIPENILRGDIKPVEKMSVSEFRDFARVLREIEFIGRAERKLIIRGENVDLDVWEEGVLANIRTLPAKIKEKQFRLLDRADAELVRMEEIVKDLDLRRELGPLFNGLIRPIMEGKHTLYKLQEDLSKVLNGIRKEKKKWLKTLGTEVPNDFFIDPDSGSPFEMRRSDLVNIMLNFGNKSNRTKFTGGWSKLIRDETYTAEYLEAKLWDWINEHATKDDWDFVQTVGDIFEGWRQKSNVLYTNTSGQPPKWLTIEPVQTRFGEYRGWYMPIIFDEHYSQKQTIVERKASENVFGPNYVSATIANGYTKERTGYLDAVEFRSSIDDLGARMNQIMNDLAYRAALMQAQKIIRRPRIRDAIKKHYGLPYDKQLLPWLQDIANHFSRDEQKIALANEYLRMARFNVVAHALGANFKIIQTPDMGLLRIISAAEKGSKAATAKLGRILHISNNLDEATELAWKHSYEIPHTYRNMDRDFRERLEQVIIRNKWDAFQATAVRWAFYPIIKVTQGFRIITFVDEYKNALAKGMNEADAAALADSFVRQRHGSTGVPDLPAIMRSNEAMKMATLFYGFFNAMYNWQRQVPGQIRRREYMKAMETIYGAVLIPSLLGALVFNKISKDENWFETIGKALGLQLGGTLPFVRDFGSLFFEGYTARSPLASIAQAMGSGYSDIKKAVQGKKVEKPVQHTANVIGLAPTLVLKKGLPLGQVGKTSEFLTDVNTGQQRPKNIMDWYRGIVHGEMKPRR